MCLRARLAPGAGLRLCRPTVSGPTATMSSAATGLLPLFNDHEMPDRVDHPAQLRGVRPLDGVADAAQPERAQRVALAPVRPVGGLDLRDAHGAHAPTGSSVSAAAPSSAEASSAVSVSVAASGAPPRPRTVSTESPRKAATSSGRRRSCSPAIVALTRLIGFCEPSDLERMSWIPASSSTARTPPPAITPVPGEAGLRN